MDPGEPSMWKKLKNQIEIIKNLLMTKFDNDKGKRPRYNNYRSSSQCQTHRKDKDVSVVNTTKNVVGVVSRSQNEGNIS